MGRSGGGAATGIGVSMRVMGEQLGVGGGRTASHARSTGVWKSITTRATTTPGLRMLDQLRRDVLLLTPVTAAMKPEST